jgi:polyhydroxyalkanoate synthase subunit PhaC
MVPIPLRPDQIIQEALDYNSKLTQGLLALREIGEVDVGVSPKEAVYREDKLVLYRYKPRVDKPARVPLLIVYALVNRPYMTDLQEDRSLVRGLLEAGQDVYLIDWGYPDGADRHLELNDYINGYIRRCVEHICKAHGLREINLLGICQGGTLSLCFAAQHPDRVRSLVTMVTPVDFHVPNMQLSQWLRNVDVDLLVDTMGNVPGELLNWIFLSLKPFRLTGQKYIDMADVMDDPKKLKNFLRMEKWIFDSPDQAGEAFRQFVRDFIQQNKLITGGLTIGGKPVDLKQVTMPVLNVFATEDHLVPPDCSTPLEKLVGTTDYSTLVFKGGHIGIYVSGRSQKEIPPAISYWLQDRM